MIVEKAVNMAKLMDIPILGIVENMSYIECPECHEKIRMFGESHLAEIAKEKNLDALGQIPMRPDIAAHCDAGRIEDIDGKEWIGAAIEKIKKAINS